MGLVPAGWTLGSRWPPLGSSKSPGLAALHVHDRATPSSWRLDVVQGQGQVAGVLELVPSGWAASEDLETGDAWSDHRGCSVGEVRGCSEDL